MDKSNNTPPPWSEAPPWANWRAQDYIGNWSWYEEKPQESRGIFAFGGRREIAKASPLNPNWKTTLQKRPENE